MNSQHGFIDSRVENGEESFKIPLSSQGNPVSTSWPCTEAAVILHSFIIPHPPTRKGIFLNSTEIQCVQNTLSLCSQISHKNRGGKKKEICQLFSCFLFGKAAFSLIPGLSHEKRRQVTQKCSWKRRRRVLKSWHFIFGVFFLFVIHCFLREHEEKLWPSWFLPQLLDMKRIFFFPLLLICTKTPQEVQWKVLQFPHIELGCFMGRFVKIKRNFTSPSEEHLGISQHLLWRNFI